MKGIIGKYVGRLSIEFMELRKGASAAVVNIIGRLRDYLLLHIVDIFYTSLN
jgi:hypothetical protein